jgi:glycerophosphoryl diester phosphodiesterase
MQLSFLHNGVTAHRGNSSEHPPNTLEAFKSAIALGVDWIEVDVRSTADGQLVICHERSTKRNSGIDLPIEDTPYEELRSLDMAWHFRNRRGLDTSQCPPVAVPLLTQALDLIKSQGQTRLSIHPKSSCVTDMVGLVKAWDAMEWIGFNDSNLGRLRLVRSLDARIPVFWDRLPFCLLRNDLKTARQLGFQAMVLHHLGVTRRRIRRIKDAGLEAGAWTVSRPWRLKILLQAGIDRIYTDDPRCLLRMKGALDSTL